MFEEMVQNDQHVNGGVPAIIGAGDQVDQPLQQVECAGMVDNRISVLTVVYRLIWIRWIDLAR